MPFPDPSLRCRSDPLSEKIWLDLNLDADFFSDWQQKIVNVVCRLYGVGSGEPPLWAFKGGHVVLHDKGDYYNFWKGLIQSWSWSTANLGSARQKSSLTLPSSHYPGHNAVQYEIRLPDRSLFTFGGYGAILFGVTPKNDTWFQIEAHSGTWGYTLFAVPKFAKDVALHGKDFYSHSSSGFQNVGPYGTSPHSDKHGSKPGLNTQPPVEVWLCGNPATAHTNPDSIPGWSEQID